MNLVVDMDNGHEPCRKHGHGPEPLLVHRPKPGRRIRMSVIERREASYAAHEVDSCAAHESGVGARAGAGE